MIHVVLPSKDVIYIDPDQLVIHVVSNKSIPVLAKNSVSVYKTDNQITITN